MRTLKKKGIKALISHLVSVSLTAIAFGGLVAYKTSLPTEPTINDLIERGDTLTHSQPGTIGSVTEQCGGDELLWLVCGLYFEARNQTEEGQYWVAQAILNRVNDSRWPNTIEGVIRQGEEKKHRCQFSFMCDGLAETIEEPEAWQKVAHIAQVAMEDYYQDVKVTCAHSYRADYVTNQKALAWFATLERDDQVGTHIFYC